MHITQRTLMFGTDQYTSSAPDAGVQPYVIAGRKLYVLGVASGALVPIGAEHLVGQMGGIWCHPMRVGDGISVEVQPNPPADEPDAAIFREDVAQVQWEWRAGPFAITRQDYVIPHDPVLICRVQITNTSEQVQHGSLQLRLPLRFTGAWFSGIPTGNAAYYLVGNRLYGRDGMQTDWEITFGATETPLVCTLSPQHTVTVAALRYGFMLAPHTESCWQFVLAASHTGASEALWQHYINERAPLPLPQRVRLAGLPHLTSADPDLTNAVALAQANLDLLQADYPDLGSYFLAGLPEYPQLFGCDTTYSIPGAVAAGFTTTARSALAQLAAYAQRACGRIPHEITTNGRVFHPGNIQETPQYTIAVYDYLRWSGDRAFAQQVFPICREGMLDLIPAFSGGGPYPYGDGMVERMGMGSRKLDAACYAIAGMQALAKLAEALGQPDAVAYRERANAMQIAFERDWWMPEAGLYADSLHSDGRPQLDGHWTAVLPVQLGLAAPERAAQVLDRLNAEFVNTWGLVHTRATEELVWTLPTGLLALAAFAYGNPSAGRYLAAQIAGTTRHGTLGTFKELIPQGLCYIQLWSAALYVQIIFEGMLGIQPNALAHELRITPHLSAAQLPLQLHNLCIGAHCLSLHYAAEGVQINHHYGPQALTIHAANATYQSLPGTYTHLKA
jgi:hypothetical protein